MSRKNNPLDGDGPDTRGLFARLVEDVIAFAICCFLIRLGVCWLVSVKIPLIILILTGGSLVIGNRIRRWRKNHDGY